jgi:hypothetical protein
MIERFSHISIRVQLPSRDVLQGELGQRRKERSDSGQNPLAKWLRKRLFKNHRLTLLVEVRK